jgi:hypothetical protein
MLPGDGWWPDSKMKARRREEAAAATETESVSIGREVVLPHVHE